MTEHKFTDEEVIKALECCSQSGMINCRACPYEASCNMGESKMQAHALDLIKRQKAEIERLDTIVNPKEHGESFFMMINEAKERAEAKIRQLKAEAVNDFIEKCRTALKNEIEISNNEIANACLQERKITLAAERFGLELARKRIDEIAKKMMEGEGK